MAKSTTNWTTVPSATKRLLMEREAKAATKLMKMANKQIVRPITTWPPKQYPAYGTKSIIMKPKRLGVKYAPGGKLRLLAPKRKPLRRRSRRMMNVKAFYYELRDEFLAAHTICAVHGKKCAATECHHTRGRAGTLLIDARWWQAVCSAGHAWIHNQIATARADGFVCKKGDWNRAPEDAETARLRGIIKELTK